MKALDAIKKSIIFSSLEEDQLSEILSITREKRFNKDEIIMQEGEQGDTMFLVVEGEVGVSKSLTMKFGDNDFRQTEKVLTSFKPDDHVVFGEMALIGQDSRSASIIARTDCLLLEINRADFLKLIEDKPGLGVIILVKLSELLINRLKQSSQDIIRLTTALSIALSK
jgi:CRP/FNR family transcriptional regulator, cyclic AMP receptor protein